MTTEIQSIIRRKIEIAVEDCTMSSFHDALAHALSHSFTKSFLENMSYEVMVEITDSSLRPANKIIDMMDSNLFGHIHLNGQLGIAGFDTAMLEFIASRLSGVKPETTGDKRPPTNTDTALCAFIMTGILASVFNVTDSDSGPIARYFMKGYTLGKAPLIYQLRHSKYAFIPIKFSDIDGKLIGWIEMILPMQSLASFCGNKQTEHDEDTRQVWHDHMQNIAYETPLCLASIMQKLSLPLGQVMGFKQGDYLELTNSSLEEICVSALGGKGDIEIFTGRLGSLKSNKAICISQTLMT